MSIVSINWSPDKKELRNFGIAMLVGFGVIGAVLFWGIWPVAEAKPTAAVLCWVFGVVAGVLGLSGTKVALPVYWAWMSIAFVMGNIISRILLALFFYGMITPIGLVRRKFFGADPLQLQKRQTDSYWIDVPQVTDKERYQRQF